ncbi:hypothetical protein MFIFM68171_07338 [Madurella fahalii]|uniref:AA1-like domain-containing protein n=1 Tax=Madurella fahalii TaxID=1157608 RepID=A0ABQ0GH99_9PEZI
MFTSIPYVLLALFPFLILAQVPDALQDVPDRRRRELSACSNRSIDNFSWTINDFEYQKSYLALSPSDPGSESAQISFTLLNPASGGVSECNATTPTGAFNASASLFCRTHVVNGYHGRVRFFVVDSDQLRIYENWMCIEGTRFGGSILFYGSATVNLTDGLACTATSSITGSWKPGDIYTERHTSCKASELIVKPTSLGAISANDALQTMIVG